MFFDIMSEKKIVFQLKIVPAIIKQLLMTLTVSKSIPQCARSSDVSSSIASQKKIKTGKISLISGHSISVLAERSLFLIDPGHCLQTASGLEPGYH